MAHRDWHTVTVARSADQVSCDLRGETAVLQLSSGVYFGLDAVGTRIWGLLAAPTSLARLVDAITREYAVERGRAEQDTLELLDDLDAHGLVTIAERS